MNLKIRPTEFAFDFSRADRVVWTHSNRDVTVALDGSPASFFVNDEQIADQFSAMLSPVLADLVDVAIAVHMADRLALRDFIHQRMEPPFQALSFGPLSRPMERSSH